MLSAATLYPRVRRANRIGDARFSFHHQRCPSVAARKRFAIARTVRAPMHKSGRRDNRDKLDDNAIPISQVNEEGTERGEGGG